MRKFALIALTVAGCADHAYDPNAPAYDPNAPTVHITTPARGTVAGDVQTITVSGDAEDDVAVASLTVNGQAVSVAADNTWTTSIPVTPGTSIIEAVATDASGNQGKAHRAFVAGPMAPIAQGVPQAITAALSAQTFDAIGRGASTFMNTADLEAMISPHNPVYEAGADNGPDCLYGMASITALSEQNAVITMTPMPGGIFLDVEFDALNVGLHLDYAAACISGSHDSSVTADHVSVTGMLAVGVADDGTFSVSLQNPNVQFTNLDVELGGVPGAIADLLDLNTHMATIMSWAIEKFMTPAVNNALTGLTAARTVNVLGTHVNVAVTPHAVSFDATGGLVDLDSSLRAIGDDGAQFVYTPNGNPSMDMSQGFEVAVADDTANQLLTSLWAAKAFDVPLDLKTGPYGDIGTLYDTVQLQAMVPPYVDATGSSLQLTVGDLVATFLLEGQPVTKIAINAQVGVTATTDSTGAIRLDVGNPTVFVDVDDQGVMGANELSNSQFETIVSFALGRVIAVGSGSIGAVPMPSVGGVSLSNLTIADKSGYLVVDGKVQ